MAAPFLFGFHLIPRAAILRSFGHIPASFGPGVLRWEELEDWSTSSLPADWESLLTNLLPLCEPSGLIDNILMWGYYMRDRVQVCVHEGRVTAIYARADLRKLNDPAVTRLARLWTLDETEDLPILADDSFLEGIREFAKSASCLFVVDDQSNPVGRFTEPHLLFAEVFRSRAYKFVTTCDEVIIGECRFSDVLSEMGLE